MNTENPFAIPAPNPPVIPKDNTLKIVLIIGGVVLLLAILFCGVMAALLIPAVNAARTAAKNVQQSNQMKQIALAMHNYHETFDQFPPAYTTDANGKPLLSWRVALLPFLERQDLYVRVDWSKPWDAPENQFLRDEMPDAFRPIPGQVNGAADETNIFVVNSPQSLFPDAVPPGTSPSATKLRECIDGTVNTIMIVELSDRNVSWTQPKDVTPQEGYLSIQRADSSKVGFADGSVRIWKNGEVNQADFDAMVTRNGREVVRAP